MNKSEAVAKLKLIAESKDIEGSHVEADEVLCKLLSSMGCEEVVAEFEKLNKWYA